MRCYKQLHPLQALSFDLDDTLYPNPEIIAKAELEMQQAIAQALPDLLANTPSYWAQQRRLLAQTQPEIRHDVSQWRLAALEQGLLSQGVARCTAQDVSEVAMLAFLQARTDVRLAPTVRAVLAALARHFKLIAITNGNADLTRMGIADLFEFSLRAGPDGRMKPAPDLFHHAAQRLQLPPSAILHIGDHPRSDIVGALNAGCQTAWITQFVPAATPLSVLPHLQISALEDLLMLVESTP